ncbi:MAG: signal peptidase I [Woeseiaceae bacterium]|nr:signal peptidase I [Woeseiaceae bacterium]
MNSEKLRALFREAAWIALIVVGVLAARSSFADHYYVPSGSMEHTLYAGDRVFVDKRAYGLRLPFTLARLTRGDPVARGDIVIFDSPRDGKRLIKRIVGTGGDTIAIIDGHLVVNGLSSGVAGEVSIERIGDKTVSLNLDGGGGPDFVSRIPQGKLLAVGDSRGNSLDGRVFGLIDEHSIYGKAIAVYYRTGDGVEWIRL